jgi:hypothetical protein
MTRCFAALVALNALAFVSAGPAAARIGPGPAGSGRVAVRHVQPRTLIPFGFPGFIGDYWDYSVPGAEAAPETPSVLFVAPSAPPSSEDRPPCRETSPDGVTTVRGMACSHTNR